MDNLEASHSKDVLNVVALAAAMRAQQGQRGLDVDIVWNSWDKLVDELDALVEGGE